MLKLNSDDPAKFGEQIRNATQTRYRHNEYVSIDVIWLSV